MSKLHAVRRAVSVGSVLGLLVGAGCTAGVPQRMLIQDYPGYASFPAAMSNDHGKRGMKVATQGCDALHKGYVTKAQQWIDCQSSEKELRIQILGLPRPKHDPGPSAEIVSMVAMIESSWCLANQLVIGNNEAVVRIEHPDGHETVTPCIHFMRR